MDLNNKILMDIRMQRSSTFEGRGTTWKIAASRTFFLFYPKIYLGSRKEFALSRLLCILRSLKTHFTHLYSRIFWNCYLTQVAKVHRFKQKSLDGQKNAKTVDIQKRPPLEIFDWINYAILCYPILYLVVYQPKKIEDVMIVNRAGLRMPIASAIIEVLY